jgi:hypothetical protein
MLAHNIRTIPKISYRQVAFAGKPSQQTRHVYIWRNTSSISAYDFIWRIAMLHSFPPDLYPSDICPARIYERIDSLDAAMVSALAWDNRADMLERLTDSRQWCPIAQGEMGEMPACVNGIHQPLPEVMAILGRDDVYQLRPPRIGSQS